MNKQGRSLVVLCVEVCDFSVFDNNSNAFYHWNEQARTVPRSSAKVLNSTYCALRMNKQGRSLVVVRVETLDFNIFCNNSEGFSTKNEKARSVPRPSLRGNAGQCSSNSYTIFQKAITRFEIF